MRHPTPTKIQTMQGLALSFIATCLSWSIGLAMSQPTHFGVFHLSVLKVGFLYVSGPFFTLGAPIFLIFSRFRAVPGWIYALAGACIGLLATLVILVTLVIALSDCNVGSDPECDSLNAVIWDVFEHFFLHGYSGINGTVTGAIGGSVFWFVIHRLTTASSTENSAG